MMDHDNVRTHGWLQAYHDGELDPRDRARVEAHLAGCPACRAELQALDELSSLLQLAPAPVKRLSDDRFVAQVGLRLTRRPVPSPAARIAGIAWRMAPVLLVAAYLFLQVASLLTGGILALKALGVGGDALGLLAPAQSEPGITGDIAGALTGLWLGPLDWIVGVLMHLPLVGPVGAVSFAFTLLIGLALWSWLALWYARQTHSEGVGD